MRRQVFAVQYPKVLWYFGVAAHRIGHPRARIDTAKSSAYQCEEHRERFEHHERLAMAAQQRITNDRHHVANRSRRAFRVGKAIGTAHEVVSGEVFEHVTEQTLDS